MLRLYLDMSALKRPYDSQDNERVLLESLAIASLFSSFETQAIEIAGSPVLEIENSMNPNPKRRSEVADMLTQFVQPRYLVSEIAIRARQIEALGLAPLDALHVAAAEHSRCDYLITCDDDFLRRARRRAQDIRVRVADPLQIVRILSLGAQE